MALDLCPSFVSVQYLVDKRTEFHQILYMHSTLRLLHIIICTFVPELWPLIYSKILFPLNILRTNGQILTKLYITIYLNLPGTPNTSSEYYMECAACANDGFEKKK